MQLPRLVSDGEGKKIASEKEMEVKNLEGSTLIVFSMLPRTQGDIMDECLHSLGKENGDFCTDHLEMRKEIEMKMASKERIQETCLIAELRTLTSSSAFMIFLIRANGNDWLLKSA